MGTLSKQSSHLSNSLWAIRFCGGTVPRSFLYVWLSAEKPPPDGVLAPTLTLQRLETILSLLTILPSYCSAMGRAPGPQGTTSTPATTSRLPLSSSFYNLPHKQHASTTSPHSPTMKLNFSALAATLALAFFTADAAQMMRQEAEAGCTLTGTYSSSASIASCSSVIINNLSVPGGVTLDLTKVKTGATITFQGTTTFGTKLWEGPLVLLTGTSVQVKGPGVLDGQGAWYWKQGTSIKRPVFFRLTHADKSTLSGFTLKNSPFRTFSILNSVSTTLTGLTLDASAGDGFAKNTDGFDLSRNTGVTISNNIIKNQDDCLAMQSSTNTVFSGNSCTGGHGISIGSLGGDAVDVSSTVSGLKVTNNKIINSVNGIRIKTIIDLKGMVSDVTYTNNVLTNVKNAIVVHSDYSKSKGGYTGSATSAVTIKGITISGLSGTATNVYDVLVNPSVVSGWSFSGVTVKGSKVGSCKGQPSTVKCA